jgi:hypothetical protein
MAQMQAAIAKEAARKMRFNRCIGYRAIPGTPVGSVWDVRKRDLRLLANAPSTHKKGPSAAAIVPLGRPAVNSALYERPNGAIAADPSPNQARVDSGP